MKANEIRKMSSEELNNKVDYIIDGGDTDIGLESTVIRVINNVIHILRPGKVTKKELEKYGKVEIDSHVLEDIKNNEKVLSPGMKYKHYAPNTKCILVYSDDKEKMYSKIKSLEDTNTIVICNSSNISKYKKLFRMVILKKKYPTIYLKY